jgi:hypothetical protein
MLWRLTWKRRGCCIDPTQIKTNKDKESTEEIRKQIYLNKSPYITQLCYIIYDVESRTTEETFCSYVKIPDNVAITEEITKLTGFTREHSDSGMDITDVLAKFHEKYKMRHHRSTI